MTTQISTQTQVSTFNFENQSIRTIAINNEPWFIAKDLCDAINISNYRDAIERLDEDEKGVALTDTLGGKQEMAVVSESGMYTLILRCRDAVKKGSVPHRFRKWVTAEVLPQIRKTGSYSQNIEPIRPLEPTYHREHTQTEMLCFASLWFSLYNCRDTLEQVSEPLMALGARLGSTAYTHATEYRNTLGLLQRILVKMLDGIETEEPHYRKALATLRGYQPRGLARIAKR
ncbi:BRO family protein [Haemophilus parahaemolyticus]|uniref:Bro-N domain-containing protein n=1 Tax=Haemophilus parahaemolyticus TaxID=735 RepID=A0A369Z6C8_HAEPH|nr:Bro-N domain-containing protein [Haemophilus parahaemolyticus]RDE99875.1 hypothetical protein DPV98_10420 [Haemophilus parahaemolyticus]